MKAANEMSPYTPNYAVRLTASHLVLFEACQKPICRVLDAREVYHGQIANIGPNMSFKLDLANQIVYDLRSHFQECRPGRRASAEP